MGKLLGCVAGAALAVSLAVVAVAAPVEFNWAGHGAIRFDVPDSWRLNGRQAGDMGYAFNARPNTPKAALLQINLAAKDGAKAVAPAELPHVLERTVRDYIAGSVEKKFTPQELPLSQGAGYFAHLTDASLVGKPPEPGNYKMMRVALAALDARTLAIITLQCDDATGAELADMMAIVRSMRFERSPSASAAPATGKPFTFSHPESRVQLEFAGAAFEPIRTEEGYFLGSMDSGRISVSGWFEPAERYGGLRAFWAKESRGQIQGMFGRDGEWETVSHATKLDDDGNVQRHLRAELVRGDTWIDLHFSTGGDANDPECARRLQRALGNVRVSPK